MEVGTCLAWSNDGVRTWRDYEENPGANPTKGADPRDLCVFWHGPTKKWILAGVASKKFDLTAEFDFSGATAREFEFKIANKTINYNIEKQDLMGKSLKMNANGGEVKLVSLKLNEVARTWPGKTD